MAAGRIYHWKHGWIPLDRAARLSKAHHGAPPSKIDKAVNGSIRSRNFPGASKLGPKSTSTGPLSSAEKIRNAEKMYGTGSKQHREAIRRFNDSVPSGVAKKAEPGGRKVQFIEGSVDLDAAQRRSVAKTVQEVFDRFPNLPGPVKISAGHREDVAGGQAWATTDTRRSKDHYIEVSEVLWDDAAVNKDGILGFRKSNGAIEGQAETPAQFRRMALIHELGHFVQDHDTDMENAAWGLEGDPREPSAPNEKRPLTEIESITTEAVTPREMGYEAVDGYTDSAHLDQQIPRFMADSLGGRSMYAMSNPSEWIAEAFLDGFVNGSRANKSSKRIYQAALNAFGPGAKKR